MKNIITLSGDIGSGKSSVAAELKRLTGYDVVGTGKIQRAIAERRGLTTLELNKISETDRSIDDEIDNYVINLGKTSDNLIIDSRLAWHFIPAAFKVFLAVDSMIGAERVFSAFRSDEDNSSLDVTLQNNLKRQEFEDHRFHKLYAVHFRQYDNYDLVIDTSYTAPEAIAGKIKECFDRRSKGIGHPALWLDPRKLIPTRPVRDYADTALFSGQNAVGLAGTEEDQAVEVFVDKGFIYLMNGHKRTLAARKAGVDLMPAKILAIGPSAGSHRFSELAAHVTSAMLHDWEEALGFKYKMYPCCASA